MTKGGRSCASITSTLEPPGRSSTEVEVPKDGRSILWAVVLTAVAAGWRAAAKDEGVDGATGLLLLLMLWHLLRLLLLLITKLAVDWPFDVAQRGEEGRPRVTVTVAAAVAVGITTNVAVE